jgi:Tfp pilus assembly protein PilF
MVKSGHLSAVWLLLGLAPPCAADDATRQQALQIASAAYTANVATLSADQQQAMIAITNGVSAKLGSDPVGHLSGAFVGMLTQGAKPQAAAAMAAWAVKQQPDSAALLNNFGYALFQLKDYPHAVTILAQSLALNGHCAECATNLGNAYLDNNQDELAKSTFQAALKIDPDHDLAWMGLADYYMKTHQVKAAVDILARRHGTGFIQKGQDKAQAALNAVSESDKCDWVLEDDSPDAACEKVAKIAKIQPVSLGPIVETMSPALAQQIAAALTRPPVKLKAPVDPSMLD